MNDEKSEIRKCLESAHAFLIQKHYAKAHEAYEIAIQIDPENPDAYYRSALSLHGQQRYAEAIERYQQAVKLQPDYVEAYNAWGLALAEQEKYDEAIERYRKAIQHKPDYVYTYQNWGNALANQKKYVEAIEQYQQAVKCEPDYVEAYNAWGRALAEQKKYAEAAEQFQETIRRKPDYVYAYQNWGNALAEQKKYAEAIEQYQQALKLKPDYLDAYNAWGLALTDQRRYTEAIERFQRAVEFDSTYFYAYQNWGNALADLNLYEEAREKYEQVVHINPEYAYAQHNIAYYLWKQGNYERGLHAWQKACEVYERTKLAAKMTKNVDHFYYWAGIKHKILGDLAESEVIYREGLRLVPDDARILISLAELTLEMKDESPESSNVDRTAAFCSARENYRKARNLLVKHMNTQSNLPGLLQLGELLLGMEEYEDAEKYLKLGMDIDRESVLVHTDLGVLYTRKEEFKKAASCFEKALKLDPDDLTVWSNLAEVYFKMKLKEKAETEYKKILRITEQHIDSHIGLGEVYTAMGDEGEVDFYVKAIAHYTKAINLGESKKGSKRLRTKELAAVYYSRGYAKVKLHEVSKYLSDSSLLFEALDDFRRCFNLDTDHHKSGRAREKLEKRIEGFSFNRLTEKIGPWLLIVPAILILLVSQINFFFEIPAKRLEIAAYVSLTFGSLVFMVIGLYLPQILKLKVAGIELEKSAVDQIDTHAKLGINR